MASPPPETAEKKKRGLGRLLGKRDKTPERPITLPDSAYASSETPSAADPAKERSTSDIIPAEKNSEIGNIDKDKNLALKPSTGEVFDRDTGEVVTVVTTTTTTTTTTTRKPGQNNDEVKKDIQREVTQGEQTIAGPSEMPANSTNVTSTSTETPKPDMLSPPIPMKSNKRENRKSAEISAAPDLTSPASYDMPPGGSFRGNTGTTPRPISPSANNFSYPSSSRGAPGVQPDRSSGIITSDHPMHHDRSTIQDLRLAAKGIHGVGETLRGTLNNTIDRRFPARDGEKAAVINAKNDAVLARGRTEMEGLDKNRRSWNSNVSPPPTTDPQPYTDPPGAWPEEEQLSADESKARKLSRDKEKASTIGKLFKRKPVGGKQDGLRVTNP